MAIDVEFIEHLRSAAREYGAVYDLIGVISNAIHIDELGNKEVFANDIELQVIKNAQLAFEFAKFDRKDEQ